MVNIKVAESAGFCFGVNRAVTAVEDLLNEGKKVATLGPLIHNPAFIKQLESRGALIIDEPEQLPDGYELVVRTHGVTKTVYERILKLNRDFSDQTCPFVKKIQNIVNENSTPERPLLIAGDGFHPEVMGFRSYAHGESFTFSSAEELLEMLKNGIINPEKEMFVVAQTTFSSIEFKKICEIVKKYCTNAKIFDTICNATAKRQKEACNLSAQSDIMVVIGGKISSNTQKLKNVCEANCKTYLVESAGEVKNIDFTGCRNIGVTAGASTPVCIIKEVLKSMSEIINPIESEVAAGQAVEDSEMSFEQALEESLKSLNSDQKVVGVVLRVTPTEIQVDIGRKQTGYIPYEEFSADPNCNPADCVNVGDELNLIIMKTNDAEGTVMLSKKRYDAQQNWAKVVEALDSKEVLKGTVVEILEKGVIVISDGTRVFIPASQALLSRRDNLADLLNKEVEFRVIDVDKRRRRVVGSINSVAREALKAQKEAFWAQAEVGQKYTGTVKNLTDFGAFVDIGGVEGLVHKSELSWNRIKHPSEVVNTGDVIEVYIKNLDTENKKISLGYKKIEDSPWEILKRDYPVGSVIDVQIVSLTTFGAFAQIIPHIQGLIHISQISNRRIDKPQDELNIGDTVKVMITAIDFEKKHVSLSVRALLAPEETAADVKEATAEDDEPVAVSIDDLLAQAEAEKAGE